MPAGAEVVTGGSAGSSCSSADRPAIVSDQVIRKHPAQRELIRRDPPADKSDTDSEGKR